MQQRDDTSNHWRTTVVGRTANEMSPVYHGAFDGWNRQVVADYSNYTAPVETGDSQTSYDGLGRLITSFVDTVTDLTNNAGTTEEFYYNESDQIVEVRKGIVTSGVKTFSPNARERTVWDASYVNAAAVVEHVDNAISVASPKSPQKLTETYIRSGNRAQFGARFTR